MMTTGLRTVLAFRLRGLTLMWAAAGVQVLRQLDPLWAAAFLTFEDGLLTVLVMWVLGAAFTAVNLRAVTVPARMALGTFALGFSLNTLTTVLNGGMPFSVHSARHAGLSEQAIAVPTVGHQPVTDQTVLTVFCDVIPVPVLRAVVSAGDLLMVVGITWLVAALVWRGAVTGDGRPRRMVSRDGPAPDGNRPGAADPSVLTATPGTASRLTTSKTGGR